MQKTIDLMASTEKIINEALRIALRERNAAHALELFLNYLGEKSGCERIYVFEGLRGENVSNTYEWCAKGVSAEKNNLQNVPFEVAAWWYDAFEQKSSIVIKDLEEIKEKEPLTYQCLKPQNVHSLIASPLVLENQIIGFYGVDNPPEEIMGHISDVAEIIGHFIASLLDKKRLMDKLEQISFEDSLSSVRNRHALNFELEKDKAIQNIGVIYCDILGLKKVNDTYGHQAGDELIVRASRCLQSCFRKTEIYRMGGDEFLVLCNGIKEVDFLNRKRQLEQEMKEKNVLMSLGCLWRKSSTDMDGLIAEADNLMYREKSAYYAAKAKENK